MHLFWLWINMVNFLVIKSQLDFAIFPFVIDWPLAWSGFLNFEDILFYFCRWMKVPRILLAVWSLSWRKKRIKDLGSTIWREIPILVEHFQGILWYALVTVNSSKDLLLIWINTSFFPSLHRTVQKQFSWGSLMLPVTPFLNHINLVMVPLKELHGIMGDYL